MRRVAVVTGVLGGLSLLVDGVAESGALTWVGLALLAVAVLCLGLTLVPTAPTWLQAVVGVGAVALAASILATLRSEADPGVVDPVIGAAAVVLFLFLALRWRRTAPREPRSQGAHSR